MHTQIVIRLVVVVVLLHKPILNRNYTAAIINDNMESEHASRMKLERDE